VEYLRKIDSFSREPCRPLHAARTRPTVRTRMGVRIAAMAPAHNQRGRMMFGHSSDSVSALSPLQMAFYGVWDRQGVGCAVDESDLHVVCFVTKVNT
jgi:hypothetical protein